MKVFGSFLERSTKKTFFFKKPIIWTNEFKVGAENNRKRDTTRKTQGEVRQERDPNNIHRQLLPWIYVPIERVIGFDLVAVCQSIENYNKTKYWAF